MECAEVEERLDKIVALKKEFEHLRDFNNQICIYSGILTQFEKGIEIIADVLGVKLSEDVIKSETTYYRYSFLYKGVTFVQIEAERLDIGNVSV